MNNYCCSNIRNGARDHAPWCISEQPLAPWERELLGQRPHDIGEGDVMFTRTDGRTVKIDNVRVESISPMGTNAGVVAVEFFGTDRVVHVPFVESWEISYRV